MKKLILAAACLLIVIQAKSQTFVKIGDMELALKSPISFSKDTNNEKHNFDREKGYRTKFEEFFVGMGLAVNTSEENYLPVYYGDSYNLEIGWRYFYRPAKGYAIGTLFQYTSNSFRLTPAAVDGEFFPQVQGEPYKQYFRTDNLGTGLINRIYISSGVHSKPVYIDLGGFVNYAYSKRFKVKTKVDGERVKYKFRDGEKFNPFEAGLMGGIGFRDALVFARYRMTNYFNSDYNVAELPRWSVGVQFNL